MDTSANEALVIGMNVLVFVIALSCAIMLMTTVLDMSEVANDIIKDTSGSSLLELYGDGEERIYTGYEILAIAQKYTATTYVSDISGGNGEFNTSGINNKFKLYIQNYDDLTKSELTSNIQKDKLKKEYYLIYDGECDSDSVSAGKCEDTDIGKLMYTFKDKDI